jgi:sulfotransferase family protein
MPVLIGGSPSTGSSLLRQMLNRHSAMYCGPESRLFTHPAIFKKWNKVKHRLLRKPLLTSPDIHLTRGVNLAGVEQGWSSAELTALINESRDFKTFCEAYFSRSALLYGKQIWMDKTPSNVLSFEAFFNTWDEGHVVHITRDPLDIVASLIQRGLSLFLAVSRYLFNTAHALKCMDNANYVLLRYETLVTSPEIAFEPLLGMLQLAYEPGMLEVGNPQMTEVDQMPGWRSSEIDLPNKRSIGRFKNLTEKEQTDIIASLNIVQINPVYARKHELTYLDSLLIADSLGYVIPASTSEAKREVMKRLRTELKRYRQKCLRERRLFYERERPIVLIGN